MIDELEDGATGGLIEPSFSDLGMTPSFAEEVVKLTPSFDSALSDVMSEAGGDTGLGAAMMMDGVAVPPAPPASGD